MLQTAPVGAVCSTVDQYLAVILNKNYKKKKILCVRFRDSNKLADSLSMQTCAHIGSHSALKSHQNVDTSCILISLTYKNNDAIFTVFISTRRKMFILEVHIGKLSLP